MNNELARRDWYNAAASDCVCGTVQSYLAALLEYGWRRMGICNSKGGYWGPRLSTKISQSPGANLQKSTRGHFRSIFCIFPICGQDNAAPHEQNGCVQLSSFLSTCAREIMCPGGAGRWLVGFNRAAAWK